MPTVSTKDGANTDVRIHHEGTLAKTSLPTGSALQALLSRTQARLAEPIGTLHRAGQRIWKGRSLAVSLSCVDHG